MGGDSFSQYDLLGPTIEGEHINREYAAEVNYDTVELAETLRSGVHNLTIEQHTVFDHICHSTDNAMGEILLLDAPGGGNINAQEFSDLLLKIDEGTYPEEEGQIVSSDNLCHTVNLVKNLIASVYGDQR
ncbi:hypothetical protein EVAR_50893_1 [Eumeta japonica]|uniref:Uncharacterized protein n=1 Tax=Eumeta variegata TaxID=151549 RepID=A0A4C1Y8L1_EUMVA|nr:hypothetical protein EVAR_50893_1 [Eumeta japonica]